MSREKITVEIGWDQNVAMQVVDVGVPEALPVAIAVNGHILMVHDEPFTPPRLTPWGVRSLLSPAMLRKMVYPPVSPAALPQPIGMTTSVAIPLMDRHELINHLSALIYALQQGNDDGT